MQILKFLKIAIISGIITSLWACAGLNGVTNNITLVQVNAQPKPTVIMLHGCDGSRGFGYHSQAQRISSWGYNVILPDSFTKRGYRDICTKGAGKLVHPNVRAQDVQQAIDWLATQPWHRGGIAVVGYSHGGSTALNVAVNPNVKGLSAAVAFYPSCYREFVGQTYWTTDLALQIHIGLADQQTPYTLCESSPKYATYLYTGAYHSFDRELPYRTNVQGHAQAYDAHATELAYSRVREFLARELSK